MEGKLRDKTRNQTRRMGLGIIPLKQITELAWLRWYGHVKMGGERYPKFLVKLEHKEKTSKERPGQTREKGIQKILKRNECEKELYLETIRDGQLFLNPCQ